MPTTSMPSFIEIPSSLESLEYFIMMFLTMFFRSNGSSLPLLQIRPSLVGYTPDTDKIWLESSVYLSRRKNISFITFDLMCGSNLDS